ncbi:MAG TPA: AMP-binding protein [Nannocystaceae bacterium]|nr:AMP-binding protein [Nannocystaceae bacterium]
MTLRDRLTARFPGLQRLLVDPPHRIATRVLVTSVRTGMLGIAGQRPLEVARILLARGLGVKSLHALHATADPDRPALVDERRTVTYRECDGEIDAIAAALRDHLGVSRSAPVAVMMENRVEYALVWFALFRLGVTCAHMGRHSTVEELEPLLDRSGARVLVVSDKTFEVAAEVLARRPELDLRVVRVGGGRAVPRVCDYDELCSRGLGGVGRLRVEAGPSDNVVYTSGTTGRPKGAVRDMAAVGPTELFRVLERLPLHTGDKHLVCAPMYHSSGQVFVLINTALGATIHFQERFDPETTLARISGDGIDNLFLVPTMIQRMVDLPDEVHARWPTPQLRALISGAAPFNTSLRERAIARFGADVVFDFYGATELGWVTLIDGHEMLTHAGSVGRAIAGQEIAIMDDEGRRLPPLAVGRVFTRSAQLMVGYLRDDETKSGQWLTVDDLGYLDADGYLYITGRARDMVISGGVNIYPVEIENALSKHPEVADVAVIGVPDAEWGERLLAVVVPRAGFDAAALEAWARERLTSYKIPRRWETLAELPRNPTGKVLKRELVERFS